MKKLLAVLLVLILALSFTACGAKLDLSGEIMPADCADVIMGTPEKMMRTFGLKPKDFEGDTLNKDGHNQLKQDVMLFGQIFDMDVEIYDDTVQRCTFTISKDDHNMQDRKMFIKLLENMTEAYGEPHTNIDDGRRYEYNQKYYLEKEAFLYEEWVYDDYDLQLIYTVYSDGEMNISLVVVVHADLDEILKENLIKG